jgi:hypothetical protein
VVYATIEGTLIKALELLARVDEVYRRGGPQIRRHANQCFVTKLLISHAETPEVTSAVLAEPWATLVAEDFRARMIRKHNEPQP